MQSDKSRAALIAEIYSAALDNEAWPHFSTLVSKAAGIEAVSVWLTEKDHIVDASMAPLYAPYMAPYREHFGKMDPWAAGLARKPLETIMLACEHIREEDLEKTEFYNDFARQGGMYRPIGVKMRLEPDVYATMGSENPFAKRLFEESDKRRVQNILPHVKCALQLRRRQQLSIPCLATRTDALNALSFGILVCDAAGRPVFVNAAAEDLVRKQAGIVLGPRGKALGTLVRKEEHLLLRLVNGAANGRAGGTLLLTGKDGTSDLLVLVTTLPRQLDGHCGPGYALVSLRSARDRPAFTASSLASLFQLSPTQAEIAIAVYEGKSPDQIANERGVRISTLRSHLAEIYIRTGTENQRDLVRLLGMFPPLRAPPG